PLLPSLSILFPYTTLFRSLLNFKFLKASSSIPPILLSIYCFLVYQGLFHCFHHIRHTSLPRLKVIRHYPAGTGINAHPDSYARLDRKSTRLTPVTFRSRMP